MLPPKKGVGPPTASYKNYLLGVLLVIFAFNAVDRAALGLVLQDIKSDLSLSDTQLGLLTGVAFAMFYSFMGIPIARWADKGNRVTIIYLTTIVWSAAVALCGAATTFVQLLLIRVGVAIGEAGCVPPAHSLISDYFNRAERPRALARYMLGAPLSVVVGFFLAGWLNEFYGWRVTFVVLGLPGLALAILARFTLREPRLSTQSMVPTVDGAGDSAHTSPEPSIKEVCLVLWKNRTFRQLLFCLSIAAFFNYGIVQWKPAFFIRSFGLQTGEVGTWFAMIYGLGGLFGTYWGGELAARRAARNESLQLKAIAALWCSFGFLSALLYMSPNHYVAFALMAITTVGNGATTGPLFATIQNLVPQRMRAMAIATIYLFANLIGMGLGPLAAGALSDAFRPLFGEESLRYALLALCPGYLWSGWHLWRASATVTRDMEVIQPALGLTIPNHDVMLDASAKMARPSGP